MNKEQVDLLGEYIKAGKSAVLIEKIPENCMIFVTYSDLKENPIEEEVYSFMAHI